MENIDKNFNDLRYETHKIINEFRMQCKNQFIWIMASLFIIFVTLCLK